MSKKTNETEAQQENNTAEQPELMEEQTEQITPESVGGSAENAEPEVPGTAAEVEQLKKGIEEAENRYLRLRADFDNFRRRVQLDREASEKYRAQDLIANLLPAIDNFERAMQIEPDNEQSKSLIEGMEMIYRSLLDALQKEGAEQIEAVGQEFDPNFHQAVMQVEDENFGSNIVVEEFQKGYKLKDRVIRPSMVKVNQ